MSLPIRATAALSQSGTSNKADSAHREASDEKGFEGLQAAVEQALALIFEYSTDHDALRAWSSDIQRALADVAILQDSGLRVGLVGAFNAGKSSLINAVFGRKVAAVDAFEMTGWVSFCGSGERDACQVVYRDRNPETLSIDEFLGRCENRQWSASDLDAIEYTRLTVSTPQLPFMFVDLPGIGASRANERRMRDALKYVDLVLWLCDVDSIGELKSIEIIRHMRAQGTPVRIAVTKCDVLDSPSKEFPEIAQAVAHAVDTSTGDVLGVSVHVHNLPPEARDAFSIPHLVSVLSHLSPHARQMRATSAQAMRRMVVEAIIGKCTETGARLAQILARHSDAMDRFGTVARSVAQQLLRDAEDSLRETLIPGRDALVLVLAEEIHKNRGNAAIGAIIGRHLPRSALERAITLTIDRIRQLELEVWSRHVSIDGVVIDEYQLGAVKQWSDAVASPGIQAAGVEQSDTADQRVFNASLATSGITAAVSTLLAASAPTITLAAAATGIGLPILAIGGIAAFFMGKKSSSEAKDAQIIAAQLVDAYVDEIARNIMAGGMAHAIAEGCQARARFLADRAAGEIPCTYAQTGLSRLTDVVAQLQSVVKAR